MMWPTRISCCDRSTLLNIGYEDLKAFHGGRYPAGVALGYKLLQLIQGTFFPDGGVLMRQKCRVETAFMGLGFRDVVEMVLRGTTSGQLKRDDAMAVPQGIPRAPVQGHFFFRFLQNNGVLECSLKPQLVPLEFYERTEALGCCTNNKKAEESLLLLRKTIAESLLAADPSELFNIHHLIPARKVTEEFALPTTFNETFLVPFQDFGSFETTLSLLQAYHGEDSLCGVCLIASLFKRFAIEKAVSTPLARRRCAIRVGAWGKGISDAITCFLRCDDDSGRLVIDRDWGESHSLPSVPGGGAFVFQINAAGEDPMVFALEEDRTPFQYFELCQQRNELDTAFTLERKRKELQLEFARSVLRDDPWVRLS